MQKVEFRTFCMLGKFSVLANTPAIDPSLSHKVVVQYFEKQKEAFQFVLPQDCLAP